MCLRAYSRSRVVGFGEIWLAQSCQLQQLATWFSPLSPLLSTSVHTNTLASGSPGGQHRGSNFSGPSHSACDPANDPLRSLRSLRKPSWSLSTYSTIPNNFQGSYVHHLPQTTVNDAPCRSEYIECRACAAAQCLPSQEIVMIAKGDLSNHFLAIALPASHHHEPRFRNVVTRSHVYQPAFLHSTQERFRVRTFTALSERLKTFPSVHTIIDQPPTELKSVSLPGAPLIIDSGRHTFFQDITGHIARHQQLSSSPKMEAFINQVMAAA